MKKELFKPLNVGVCSYFLMVYSSLQILLKLWFTSYLFDLADYLSFGVILLIMLTGIFAFARYKRTWNNFPDSSKMIAAKSVNLIVGFIFLVMILQYIILTITMSIGQNNLSNSLSNLIYLLVFSTLIIFAVVNLIRGFRARTDLSVSNAITYLCFHVVLWYAIISSIYKLLVWIGNTLIYLESTGISPLATRMIFSQILLIAISLVLLFIPFRFKKNIKSSTDNQSSENLIAFSFIVSGYIMLLIGVIDALNILIRNLGYLISNFEEYSSEYFYRPFFEILPVLILLTISTIVIVYGKKHLKNI